jgi:hypothetical protein
MARIETIRAMRLFEGYFESTFRTYTHLVNQML